MLDVQIQIRLEVNSAIEELKRHRTGNEHLCPRLQIKDFKWFEETQQKEVEVERERSFIVGIAVAWIVLQIWLQLVCNPWVDG